MSRSPLDLILDQIMEMLQTVEANKKNPISTPPTPELQKQIEKLRKDVETFSKITASLTENATHIPPVKLPEELEKQEQQAIDRAEKLRKEVQNMQLDLSIKIAKAKGDQPKKLVKKRKNKFRGLGDSGKGWKRL